MSGGRAAAAGVDFVPLGELDASVRESMRRIEESELLPASVAASGYVYDVRSRRLRPI